MASEKVLHFVAKKEDLNQLSQEIVQYLKNDGYKTQATAPQGMIIQAQKAGILRDIITADRAFTIMITGQPQLLSNPHRHREIYAEPRSSGG
jgi:hypothetical protein